MCTRDEASFRSEGYHVAGIAGGWRAGICNAFRDGLEEKLDEEEQRRGFKRESAGGGHHGLLDYSVDKSQARGT